jgi:hypothetical protein
MGTLFRMQDKVGLSKLHGLTFTKQTSLPVRRRSRRRGRLHACGQVPSNLIVTLPFLLLQLMSTKQKSSGESNESADLDLVRSELRP